MLGGPEQFFRSFTVKELGRLMSARPTDLDTRPRAHEMGIYKRYFDLIAAGVKTTEIRVNDSSRQKIVEGSLIRFRCRDEEILTRVTRVTRITRYPRRVRRNGSRRSAPCFGSLSRFCPHG